MKNVLFAIILIAIRLVFSEPMLFLHHSCGNNLINEGNVRFWLDSLNTANGTDHTFWDHGYNYQGLRNPEGVWLGYNWDVPDDNTYPCGFARIFNQEVDTFTCPNFFSHVIDSSILFAFKSCFPTCEIDPDDTSYDLIDSCHQTIFNYKRLYREIRDIIDMYPNRMFVPLTPPPLVPSATTPEQAARARHFAIWLTDTFPYEDGPHPNIAVFDFWTLLAENDSTDPDYNCLRYEYRRDPDGDDSHPNELANQTIGPIFAQFLYYQLNTFLSIQEKQIFIKNLKISAVPNPFNSSCIITAPKNSKIAIYDIRGNLICRRGLPTSNTSNTSIDNSSKNRHREMSPTEYRFIWTPDKSVPSGIYFIKAITPDRLSIIERIVYIR